MAASDETLGSYVRQQRRRANLTQEQLGEAAGYGAGAGVSISRVENGQVEPTPERLKGIATALGLPVSALEQFSAGDGSRSSKRGESRNDLASRGARVQRELERRAERLTGLVDALYAAEACAQEDFLLRFVGLAGTIGSARVPGLDGLSETTTATRGAAEVEAERGFRFTRFGVGQALQGNSPTSRSAETKEGATTGPEPFTAFIASVAGGIFAGATASGAAGTAGAAGAITASRVGAIVTRRPTAARPLANVAALPFIGALAALGGLLVVTMRERNRRQQQEIETRLSEAESELAETRPSTEALADLLTRATDALRYIATHAGHALGRWERALGPAPREWESMTPQDQRRFAEFVDIAAAHVEILAIDFQALSEGRGQALEAAVALADETLTRAHRVITKYV